MEGFRDGKATSVLLDPIRDAPYAEGFTVAELRVVADNGVVLLNISTQVEQHMSFLKDV